MRVRRIGGRVIGGGVIGRKGRCRSVVVREWIKRRVGDGIRVLCMRELEIRSGAVITLLHG